MSLKDVAIGIFLALLIVSILDLFLDPYYHRSNVNFWVWLKREIIEFVWGEKE